jgi:hypothetical protein
LLETRNLTYFITGRNTNLLRSADKYGKNVKAIAVTGSINAITMGDVEDRKRRVMSDTEWLPVSQTLPNSSHVPLHADILHASSPETTRSRCKMPSSTTAWGRRSARRLSGNSWRRRRRRSQSRTSCHRSSWAHPCRKSETSRRTSTSVSISSTNVSMAQQKPYRTRCFQHMYESPKNSVEWGS